MTELVGIIPKLQSSTICCHCRQSIKAYPFSQNPLQIEGFYDSHYKAFIHFVCYDEVEDARKAQILAREEKIRDDMLRAIQEKEILPYTDYNALEQYDIESATSGETFIEYSNPLLPWRNLKPKNLMYPLPGKRFNLNYEVSANRTNFKYCCYCETQLDTDFHRGVSFPSSNTEKRNSFGREFIHTHCYNYICSKPRPLKIEEEIEILNRRKQEELIASK